MANKTLYEKVYEKVTKESPAAPLNGDVRDTLQDINMTITEAFEITDIKFRKTSEPIVNVLDLSVNSMGYFELNPKEGQKFNFETKGNQLKYIEIQGNVNSRGYSVFLRC